MRMHMCTCLLFVLICIFLFIIYVFFNCTYVHSDDRDEGYTGRSRGIPLDPRPGGQGPAGLRCAELGGPGKTTFLGLRTATAYLEAHGT